MKTKDRERERKRGRKRGRGHKVDNSDNDYTAIKNAHKISLYETQKEEGLILNTTNLYFFMGANLTRQER